MKAAPRSVFDWGVCPVCGPRDVGVFLPLLWCAGPHRHARVAGRPFTRV